MNARRQGVQSIATRDSASFPHDRKTVVMESVMRKIIFALLVAAGSLSAAAASAQEWAPYGGRPAYYAAGRGGSGDDVCSGRRAHMLEGWVGRKTAEGAIDPDRADRFHAEIDRLEDRARHECREGDWRGIQHISDRYASIEGAVRAAGRDRW